MEDGPLLAHYPAGSCLSGLIRPPLWSGGFRQWLRLATGPVAAVGILEEVLAVDTGTQTGTGKKSPGQLAVQGIGLLRRWAEPVLQQHRDEALHTAGSVPRPKVIWALGGKGLSQDHHSLHMGIGECLGVGENRGRALLLTKNQQAALSSAVWSVNTSTRPIPEPPENQQPLTPPPKKGPSLPQSL